MRDIPPNMSERLIVALDVRSVALAVRIVDKLGDLVNFYKIGHHLMLAPGTDRLISRLTRWDKKLFLDLKLYDIPDTVTAGVSRAVERGASIVTVHGDHMTMEAAMKGRAGKTRIFAVTALTSLGVEVARETVELTARSAEVLGLDGIICSARDVPRVLRQTYASDDLLVATPGIRMSGGEVFDQLRTASPREAIRLGADYIVVGRPIIHSINPHHAAQEFIREMELGEVSLRSWSGLR